MCQVCATLSWDGLVWRNTPASLVRSPPGASAHPVNTGKNDFLQIHHLTFFSNFSHLPSRIPQQRPVFPQRELERRVAYHLRQECDHSHTRARPSSACIARAGHQSLELGRKHCEQSTLLPAISLLLCDATPASSTHQPDSSTRLTHPRRSRLHHWRNRCRRNLRRGIRQTFVAFLYCSPLRYAGWRVYIHPPTHQATSSVHRQRHHPSLAASWYCQ